MIIVPGLIATMAGFTVAPLPHGSRFAVAERLLVPEVSTRESQLLQAAPKCLRLDL